MNSRMVRQEMLPSSLVGTKADNGFGRLEVELLPVITKSSFSSMELEVDCRGEVVGHLGTWVFRRVWVQVQCPGWKHVESLGSHGWPPLTKWTLSHYVKSIHVVETNMIFLFIHRKAPLLGKTAWRKVDPTCAIRSVMLLNCLMFLWVTHSLLTNCPQMFHSFLPV